MKVQIQDILQTICRQTKLKQRKKNTTMMCTLHTIGIFIFHFKFRKLFNYNQNVWS
jgi:hypothetical protein